MRRATHEKILADRERSFQREREAFLRERQDLLDRIMYLAERPWSVPPAELQQGPAPEVAWDGIVQPEDITADELGELAYRNGDET